MRATVAGETLTLFPERAAYWERRRTLLIADVHFGKAATFRAEGIPVPHGTTAEGLRRLDGLLDATDASRVVFLGDFLHAREGRARGTLRVLSEWRERRRGLELLLVRGNHDQHAGDPEPDLDVRCVDAPYVEAPFAFAHRPGVCDDGYVLAGHIHPSVRLIGAGRQSARLPCFWFGPRGGVLPAFGDFTGFGDADVADGDQVWVIAEGKVVQLVVAR
ncbi:MAG TPA: ligase-associated DNA damage response endonuclease PdeM [Gemmatimonadaceae bacterium]|nr:ligase-associated DNA damage response endonuclease PdeM [Gemmatimonadaceae bacterium]